MTGKLWVCDWTEYQGGPCPAERITSEGFAMVKLKVGGSIAKGWSWIDPSWRASSAALVHADIVPAAYWYLHPDNPTAQAGLFIDMLNGSPIPLVRWATFLDVEHPKVTMESVHTFWRAWSTLTVSKPLALYTRRSFWTQMLDADRFPTPSLLFPVLEEAHWVSADVRNNANSRYASQQAHAIDPQWWSPGYGGWKRATMLQFTDHALVAGKYTTASVFDGTLADMRRVFEL